jgi:acid phosphatase family membrane protein YuiD
MFLRIFKFSVLIVAIVAIAISVGADVSFAQQKKSKSKAKITVPPGGCAITDAALQNGQTCAAGCKDGWCTVSWCVNGTLNGSWVGCYEPSGLCTPKC